MLHMGDQRHKRAHPKGQRDQMTAAWKAAVIAELERRHADAADPAWYGRSQTELARRLGRSKSAVGKLLKADQTASALVKPISDILGVQLPVLGTDDEIAELVAKMDPKKRPLAVELLRLMLK